MSKDKQPLLQGVPSVPRSDIFPPDNETEEDSLVRERLIVSKVRAGPGLQPFRPVFVVSVCLRSLRFPASQTLS